MGEEGGEEGGEEEERLVDKETGEVVGRIPLDLLFKQQAGPPGRSRVAHGTPSPLAFGRQAGRLMRLIDAASLRLQVNLREPGQAKIPSE